MLLKLTDETKSKQFYLCLNWFIIKMASEFNKLFTSKQHI